MVIAEVEIIVSSLDKVVWRESARKWLIWVNVMHATRNFGAGVGFSFHQPQPVGCT
jgi:hypothetical protein